MSEANVADPSRGEATGRHREIAEKYPAPGVRGYGEGALWDVGNSGYSWSSIVAGTNARFLYFHSGGLHPQYSHGRANGRQLRCLQE